MQIWTEILRELANFSDSEVTHTREIVKALTYIWISHDCRVKANCLAGQISPAAIWTELWPRQRALGLLYKGGTQACQEWATDNEKKMGTRWVRRCSLEWVGSHLYERKKKKKMGKQKWKNTPAEADGLSEEVATWCTNHTNLCSFPAFLLDDGCSDCRERYYSCLYKEDKGVLVRIKHYHMASSPSENGECHPQALFLE